MPNISIRNLPDDIYGLIKLIAKTNRRSINSEMICMLVEVVEKEDIIKKTKKKIK